MRTLAVGRRELAASWQLGIAPGVGGGLIHAPTLLAPLVRHDRVHDNDQTTVTLWDLRAWEAPSQLSRGAVAWQRGMLRRAVKHADAVVVPSHSMAERLSGLAKLGDRIRVIAGAPPQDLLRPADVASRRADLGVPADYLVLSGPEDALAAGFRGAAAANLDAVVIGAAEGRNRESPRSPPPPGCPSGARTSGDARGLGSRRRRRRGPRLRVDRCRLRVAVARCGGDVARRPRGRRGVRVSSRRPRRRGAVVSESALPEAVEDAATTGRERLRVLAADRSRAFSWASSAERVWSLHADL